MKSLSNNPVRLFQALSLDVVTGVLAMGLFAVSYLRLTPGAAWWWVLALSVWVVYTTDHLMDSFSKKDEAAIYRHRLHFKYRTIFFTAIILAATIAISMAYIYLNSRIFRYGFVLGTAAAFYFLSVYIGREKGIYFYKELFISLFYVAGIWLEPWVQTGGARQPLTFLLITGFVLLAWAEGLVVAIYDEKNDLKDGHPSFVTRYGLRKGKRWVTSILSLHFLLLLAGYFIANNPLQFCALIIETAMNLALTVMFLNHRFFGKTSYYKLFGEIIFWIPAFLHFC